MTCPRCSWQERFPRCSGGAGSVSGRAWSSTQIRTSAVGAGVSSTRTTGAGSGEAFAPVALLAARAGRRGCGSATGGQDRVQRHRGLVIRWRRRGRPRRRSIPHTWESPWFVFSVGGRLARALLPLPLFLCVGVLVVGLLRCAIILRWVIGFRKTTVVSIPCGRSGPRSRLRGNGGELLFGDAPPLAVRNDKGEKTAGLVGKTHVA